VRATFKLSDTLYGDEDEADVVVGGDVVPPEDCELGGCRCSTGLVLALLAAHGTLNDLERDASSVETRIPGGGRGIDGIDGGASVGGSGDPTGLVRRDELCERMVGNDCLIWRGIGCCWGEAEVFGSNRFPERVLRMPRALLG
jgi:hypothetical protein